MVTKICININQLINKDRQKFITILRCQFSFTTKAKQRQQEMLVGWTSRSFFQNNPGLLSPRYPNARRLDWLLHLWPEKRETQEIPASHRAGMPPPGLKLCRLPAATLALPMQCSLSWPRLFLAGRRARAIATKASSSSSSGNSVLRLANGGVCQEDGG
jgi:hypothetical protein